MPQSLSRIYLHIVFSTKHREPHLQDPVVRQKVHAYMGGICRNMDCAALTIGGTEDHTHILCRLSRSVAVDDLLHEVKRSSSLWVKKQWAEQGGFHWQNGYGGFSLGPGELPAITQYICNQEQHHGGISFQDELRRIMRHYGMTWDERYIWD